MRPGQPDLFTRRVRQLPATAEIALHRAVAALLWRSARSDWLWTHFPAGELRDDVTGRKLKEMGLKTGWSDFILVSPAGAQLHALELKRRGKKPSEAQLAFLNGVVAAGGEAACVDSVDAAIAVLKAWGAVRVAA